MTGKYILIKDVKTPVVMRTPLPHKPVCIRYKTFKAGQQVSGQIQVKDGKPAYLLVGRQLVIPISAVKELVTKDITSNADGSDKKDVKKELEKKLKTGNPKTKYMDAAILGALIGVGGAWFAEKRGWIAVPDKKNKLYGAAIGAFLMAYIVYRVRNK